MEKLKNIVQFLIDQSDIVSMEALEMNLMPINLNNIKERLETNHYRKFEDCLLEINNFFYNLHKSNVANTLLHIKGRNLHIAYLELINATITDPVTECPVEEKKTIDQVSKGIQVNIDVEDNLDSEEAKSSSPVPIKRTVEKISSSPENLPTDESDHGKDSLKRRTTDGLVTKHPEMLNETDKLSSKNFETEDVCMKEAMVSHILPTMNESKNEMSSPGRNKLTQKSTATTSPPLSQTSLDSDSSSTSSSNTNSSSSSSSSNSSSSSRSSSSKSNSSSRSSSSNSKRSSNSSSSRRKSSSSSTSRKDSSSSSSDNSPTHKSNFYPSYMSSPPMTPGRRKIVQSPPYIFQCTEAACEYEEFTSPPMTPGKFLDAKNETTPLDLKHVAQLLSNPAINQVKESKSVNSSVEHNEENESIGLQPARVPIKFNQFKKAAPLKQTPTANATTSTSVKTPNNVRRPGRKPVPYDQKSKSQFQCDHCKKIFKSTGGKSRCMLKHANAAAGIKFRCDCGKEYGRKDHLRDHQRKNYCTRDLKTENKN